MTHKFPTLAAFMAATVKHPEKWLRFNVSPGGAASLLGVSRQRVHQLLTEGRIDAVLTDDGYGLLDSEQVRQRAKSLTHVKGKGKVTI